MPINGVVLPKQRLLSMCWNLTHPFRLPYMYLWAYILVQAKETHTAIISITINIIFLPPAILGVKSSFLSFLHNLTRMRLPGDHMVANLPVCRRCHLPLSSMHGARLKFVSLFIHCPCCSYHCILSCVPRGGIVLFVIKYLGSN